MVIWNNLFIFGAMVILGLYSLTAVTVLVPLRVLVYVLTGKNIIQARTPWYWLDSEVKRVDLRLERLKEEAANT
jgi:hypothetical protein